MKMKLLLFLFAISLVFVACTKGDSATKDSSNTVIKQDSSQFNGRLFVYTYELSTGNKLGSTDTYLYINYEDLKRGLYLYKIISNSSSAESDFGFLLQGNYYVVSSKNTKGDTSLVQVLGDQRITKRTVYLK